MSSTIWEDFTVPDAVDTHGAEVSDVMREIAKSFAETNRGLGEGWRLWSVSGPASDVPVGSVHGGGSRPSGPLDVLTIERDENGQVVVADPVGAAYGVGAGVGEALAMWDELAREHYADLGRNEPRLHPRLHRQLLFLRKVFG